MCIDQANGFAIAKILEKMGIEPEYKTNTVWVYHSPMRISIKPDFEVNLTENEWFDKGTAEGGNLFGLVQGYLKYHKEPCTVKDVLRFIKVMSGSLPRIQPLTVLPEKPIIKIGIESVEPISHPGLFNEIRGKGIDQRLALIYLNEIKAYNPDKKTTTICLGSENDDGGYNILLDNQHIETAPNYVRFIRGKKLTLNRIHIFKDDYDFLSLLTKLKSHHLDDDVIVVNSYQNIPLITPYIANYGYKTITTWLPNDSYGNEATKLISDYVPNENGLKHHSANHVFIGHRTVNDWHLYLQTYWYR